MILWRTNTNGLGRCVRIRKGRAVKTPYLFNRVKQFWFLNLFRRFVLGLMSNRAEARLWRERGHLSLNGVSLCPLKSYLWGLVLVMPEVQPLPENLWPPRDRESLDQEAKNFMTRVPIMEAGAWLMGANADNFKPDSYGLLNGKVVMVDYGLWVSKQDREERRRMKAEMFGRRD